MKSFIKSILIIPFLIVTFSCTDSKPNILIILADDAGYSDFGFMGSDEIKTPNLDKLASDGVIFNNAYVSASVCSPSRAGLLTGMYQQRFGHECNLDSDVNNSFDPNQITIAEALKTKGYRTGLIGKWHLGDKKQNHPLNNGFDYFWGFISGARNYFYNPSEESRNSIRNVVENNSPTKFDGYLTDVLGDKAVDFIEKNHQSNSPFFLFLSFNAPHTPMQAKKEVLEKFKDNPRKVYASMMWSMDEAIGSVINELKENDQYNNTIIYFLSDNGATSSKSSSSPFPFKGWKGNQYEGGIKTPMIMTWKNKIKPNTQFNGFISSLDIFKTSLEVSNVNKSSMKNADGKNIMSSLNNKTIENEDLFWRKDKMATVRSGNYKLIRLNDTSTVLYNIKKNYYEDLDLKTKEPNTHDSLFKKLSNWEMSLIKPNWIENKNWNIVTEMIYQDLMSNKEIRAFSPKDINQ
ncbi:sulfatase-like hydrolase/transferase [Flavobacteriaceae bacterium]|nr:sulfatase-like hydrolase/transferase [Flavobacteriaceae bacterium]